MGENTDKTGFFSGLLKKIKPAVLRKQGRPKGLPLFAPDCGWNHGEPIPQNRELRKP